jgi:hypothetical protein
MPVLRGFVPWPDESVQPQDGVRGYYDAERINAEALRI